MYQIIYDFILQNLYNGSALNNTSTSVLGATMTMNQWLAHTTTIVCISLIVVFLVLFVRWIFRLVSGLFMLK